MNFQEERSFLNHSAFKNDFLSRLTRRMDVITDRTMDFDDRISAAAQFLVKTGSVTKNIQRAIQVWLRDPDGALAGRIATLLSKAQGLGPVHITAQFDLQKTECLAKLARMDAFMQDLEELLVQGAPHRERRVFEFWRDALQIHDFLADLDPASPKFWDFFSLSDSSAKPPT